ncbi:MAG: hypothetical protein Q8P31_00575 [Bacillota bacterium]|nr:hypothetical protein [Bacillota bacterium]
MGSLPARIPTAGFLSGTASAPPAAPPEGAARERQPRLEVYRLDKESGRYAKLIFRDDYLVGAMLIGEPDLAHAAARAVQSRVAFDGLAQIPEARRFEFAADRIRG